jgi:hypothetical protein
MDWILRGVTEIELHPGNMNMEEASPSVRYGNLSFMTWDNRDSPILKYQPCPVGPEKGWLCLLLSSCTTITYPPRCWHLLGVSSLVQLSFCLTCPDWPFLLDPFSTHTTPIHGTSQSRLINLALKMDVSPKCWLLPKTTRWFNPKERLSLQWKF